MPDAIDFKLDGLGDVVAYELEPGVIPPLTNVGLAAGKVLSRQSTSSPPCMRRSTKWEPRKPAPPVTKLRIGPAGITKYWPND